MPIVNIRDEDSASENENEFESMDKFDANIGHWTGAFVAIPVMVGELFRSIFRNKKHATPSLIWWKLFQTNRINDSLWKNILHFHGAEFALFIDKAREAYVTAQYTPGQEARIVNPESAGALVAATGRVGHRLVIDFAKYMDSVSEEEKTADAEEKKKMQIEDEESAARKSAVEQQIADAAAGAAEGGKGGMKNKEKKKLMESLPKERDHWPDTQWYQAMWHVYSMWVRDHYNKENPNYSVAMNTSAADAEEGKAGVYGIAASKNSKKNKDKTVEETAGEDKMDVDAPSDEEPAKKIKEEPKKEKEEEAEAEGEEGSSAKKEDVDLSKTVAEISSRGRNITQGKKFRKMALQGKN
jgi:hypothetical protein